jgi:hypothetical protein
MQHKGYFVMWLMFLLGQGLSILMRADLFASSKYTPWHNVWAYLQAHVASLLYTLFFSSCLFWLWWRDPYILMNWGINVARYFPLTLATAGLYGAMSDKVVSYIMTKSNKVLPADKENN